MQADREVTVTLVEDFGGEPDQSEPCGIPPRRRTSLEEEGPSVPSPATEPDHRHCQPPYRPALSSPSPERDTGSTREVGR